MSPQVVVHGQHSGAMVRSKAGVSSQATMLTRLEGPGWPTGGEIDMVEAVNDYTNNQVTLHTAEGCSMPTSDVNVLGISGSLTASTNCGAVSTANAGCGVRDNHTNSFGAPFNSNGGGVFASKFRPYLLPGAIH